MELKLALRDAELVDPAEQRATRGDQRERRDHGQDEQEYRKNREEHEHTAEHGLWYLSIADMVVFARFD